jgi:uncharacterized protein YhhL (DUF1145 family)
MNIYSPSGNMILLGEYIFIFPSPACNKCIICHIVYNFKLFLHCMQFTILIREQPDKGDLYFCYISVVSETMS